MYSLHSLAVRRDLFSQVHGNPFSVVVKRFFRSRLRCEGFVLARHVCFKCTYKRLRFCILSNSARGISDMLFPNPLKKYQINEDIVGEAITSVTTS